MRRATRVFGVGIVLLGTVAALTRFLPAPRLPDHPFFSHPGPEVIAHRGGRGLWPENTLYAFRRAAVMGADVVEMDVRRTADGVWVVIHDPELDRTTDGSGTVETHTSAEIETLDAGYWWTGDGGASYPYRARGIRVPTLKDVLLDLPNQRMNIELKTPQPEWASSLCGLIRDSRRQATVLLASFHQEALDRFRAECPEVATAATAREVSAFMRWNPFSLNALYRPHAEAFQVPERVPGLEVVTPGFIAGARKHNVRVHVWTVNRDEEMQRLLALGVDGIMTDHPDRMLRLLGRAGQDAAGTLDGLRSGSIQGKGDHLAQQGSFRSQNDQPVQSQSHARTGRQSRGQSRQ